MQPGNHERPEPSQFRNAVAQLRRLFGRVVHAVASTERKRVEPPAGVQFYRTNVRRSEGVRTFEYGECTLDSAAAPAFWTDLFGTDRPPVVGLSNGEWLRFSDDRRCRTAGYLADAEKLAQYVELRSGVFVDRRTRRPYREVQLFAPTDQSYAAGKLCTFLKKNVTGHDIRISVHVDRDMGDGGTQTDTLPDKLIGDF